MASVTKGRKEGGGRKVGEGKGEEHGARRRERGLARSVGIEGENNGISLPGWKKERTGRQTADDGSTRKGDDSPLLSRLRSLPFKKWFSSTKSEFVR